MEKAKKKEEDEVKHKDFCTDEVNANQLQTEKKRREMQDLQAKIEDLEMAIRELAKAIEGLEAEITGMQVQLKRAGEDREKQNKESQSTVELDAFARVEKAIDDMRLSSWKRRRRPTRIKRRKRRNPRRSERRMWI